MRRLMLFTIFALSAGCSPVIDARLRLIDVSRQGLARVVESIDERQQVLASLQAIQRRQLDSAFDADAKRQSNLTDAWVIEARTAYAAAIDAFAARQLQGERAADADRQNIAAIDAALRQIESLDQSQLKLANVFERLK